MLSALFLALREGVEAALVVGIVLVYLDRTGRSRLARYVWSGVALAVALSLVVALFLEHWKVSQDGFEGLLLLLAACLVITMIVWMNRVARRLRQQIEQRVESFARRASLAAGLGVATFVFLMVLREGVELALILRAVQVSSEGVSTWIGTVLGLAAAVIVGVFFFKGTLRVPLGRFFSATSTVLVLVAFQLALTGVHELSEAMWIPSSKREMALIGPIVRNDVFFFVFILGACVLLVLREWLALAVPRSGTPAAGANQAERRRLEWERRKQRGWLIAAAAVCVVVLLALTAEFVYARAAAAAPQAQALVPQDDQVRIPLDEVGDANLHFFTVDVRGVSVRFLVVRKPGGWGTALDACMICGSVGYRQQGSNVICRHCASAIYIPSIGEAGGCNPVRVASRVEANSLVIDLAALDEASRLVPQ